MFSKACEYGIRAVICIMSRENSIHNVSIKEICHEIDAPEHFTAKILQKLVRKEIISSIKGPGGGFYISSEQKDILLLDVVVAIDGNNLFTGCALGLHQCNEETPCPLHPQFKKVREQISSILRNTTIHELSTSLNSGQSFLKLIHS